MKTLLAFTFAALALALGCHPMRAESREPTTESREDTPRSLAALPIGDGFRAPISYLSSPHPCEGEHCSERAVFCPTGLAKYRPDGANQFSTYAYGRDGELIWAHADDETLEFKELEDGVLLSPEGRRLRAADVGDEHALCSQDRLQASL